MTPVASCERKSRAYLVWLGPNVPSIFWVADVPQVSVKFANKCQTKIWILKQLLHGKSACGHLRIVSSRFNKLVNKQGNMILRYFKHLCFAAFSWQTFSLFQGSRCTGHGLWNRRPNKNHVPGNLLSGNETRQQKSCEVTLGDRGPHGHQLQLSYIFVYCLYNLYQLYHIISLNSLYTIWFFFMFILFSFWTVVEFDWPGFAFSLARDLVAR